ncbi:hypothetical protein [Streptomyces javensis]|uniref:Uncharacterized protein n=1 Tax=Streptomyces javensis TaxID=114698 RepID=A0ABS0R3K2_9ACTN|nr:hypothetical protein [Streptomyces javensis]MBI0311648.1 hypothetical protein [Streptomyces javensis]
MADEQPPVIRLTDQTSYEVTAEGGAAKIVSDFGILIGDSAAFGALAKAAGRAVWAVRDAENDMPPRPLYIPQEVKEAAERKARSERRDLAVVMRDGFKRYIDGGIEPVKPKRAPRRAPGEKPTKSLPSASLRMSDEDWAPIESRCKADKERLNFLVNPSRVITQYLRDDYCADDTTLHPAPE